LKRLLMLALLLFPCTALAEQWPGFIDMVADSTTSFAISSFPRQPYLTSWMEPTFRVNGIGPTLTRLGYDSLNAISGVPGGFWSNIIKHTNHRVEPWQRLNEVRLSLKNSDDRIAVFAGYYDTHHAVNPKPKPNPWLGSPNVTFVGNPDSTNGNCPAPNICWDTSAIRIDNLTNRPLTGVVVACDIANVHYGVGGAHPNWGTNTIPVGGTLIVAQTAGNGGSIENFDGSDDTNKAGCFGCDTLLCQDSIRTTVPVVKITIDGITTKYFDTGQTLNTGGVDAAGCPWLGGPFPQTRYDESRSWVQIFTTPPAQIANPTKLLLSGSSYSPLTPTASLCGSSGLYDWRWNPTPSLIHQNGFTWDIVSINKAGDSLSLWKSILEFNGCMTVTLKLTGWIDGGYGPVDGLGNGEGNISNDGRFLAVYHPSTRRVEVIDLPNWGGPPYQVFPGKTLTDNPCPLPGGDCTIDNISMSQLGNFIDVKYTGAAPYGNAHRILAFTKPTPTKAGKISFKTYTTASEVCTPYVGLESYGFAYPLLNADLAVGDDGITEYLVGVRDCSTSDPAIGHIARVQLSNNATTFITNGTNEAIARHVSCRNIDRAGWAYVTYANDPNKVYSDEIVSIKIDGASAFHVQRWADTHTKDVAGIDSQARAVPSWDGKRVVFTSNWNLNCSTTCGNYTNPIAYVIDARSGGGCSPLPAPKMRRNIREAPAAAEFGLLVTSRIIDVQGRTVTGRPGRGVYWRIDTYKNAKVVVRVLDGVDTDRKVYLK